MNQPNNDKSDDHGQPEYGVTADTEQRQATVTNSAKLKTCTVTPVYANLQLHPYHRPTAIGWRPIAPDNEPTL